DQDSEKGEGRASSRGVQKLFDVRGLGLVDSPRGMEFVPTQKRFYFASVAHGQQDTLFVTDEHGVALPPLSLTYPAGVDPLTMILQFEGLGYIPRTSAVFPDHLLAITIRLPDFNSVIEIIRFDRVRDRIVGGTVVKEIGFGMDSPLYTYFLGVEHVGNPDRLIVTAANLGNE